MMNPLIQREFFSILRKRRAASLLVALAVVFSLLVLIRWPSDGVGRSDRRPLATGILCVRL